jgi:hypothetical protein
VSTTATCRLAGSANGLAYRKTLSNGAGHVASIPGHAQASARVASQLHSRKRAPPLSATGLFSWRRGRKPTSRSIATGEPFRLEVCDVGCRLQDADTDCGRLDKMLLRCRDQQ